MKREIWIDWMRVLACFMVLVVHSTEPFYLGGEGSLVLTRADAWWAAFFDSFVRACVPLFIVASSYLQFPLHYSTGEFFRKRAVRILVPFLIWSLVYALAWGEPVENLKGLLLNFNYAAGHLWFVYMLIGLYLIMPLLSPWAEKVSRKELQAYLALWLLTTLIPLLRDALAGIPEYLLYGPCEMPRQALYPLWGEASWNSFGLFYYVSGLAGYLLLGLYFRKFVPRMSAKKTLAIALPLFAAGFAITFGGFIRRLLASAQGSFPFEGSVAHAIHWEATWGFDTLGIVLMTTAWILLFRLIEKDGAFYRRIILPLSKAGYGMYLCHMIVLVVVSGAFRSWLGLGTAGVLGVWTTPVQILGTALVSFTIVALFSVLVQRIPKAGKWIIG